MEDYKERLFDRIKNLEAHQLEMVIFDLMLNATEKQLESMEEEVAAWERIHKKNKKITHAPT